MIAYLDSSVLLRIALGQADALKEWSQIRYGVSSFLLQVETLRTLDRLRVRATLNDAEIAKRRNALLQLLQNIELVEVDSFVLERASHPFSTELGTLDAIHLATALLWREKSGKDLVIATHDIALSLAAQAHGFTVIGIR